MTLLPNQISNQETKDIDVEKLPSIPHTLIKLIDAFHDQDIDFKQISDIIQKDPALTTKMLSVANSAAYSQCTFKDFERVLVILGMDTVKAIATTAAVQQFFSQFNSDTDGHVGKFWLSSLHAAFFAKAIAKLVGYPCADEAYLGGLIHQIGQLIFLSQYYEDYANLIDESKSLTDLRAKEVDMFGFSSAELGSRLVNSWHTESMLEDAILYQEAEIEHLFDTPLLIRIINLAHRFGIQMSTADCDKPAFFAQGYQLFGLTEAVVEDLCLEIQTDIKHAAQALGVELDDVQGEILNQGEYSLSLAAHVKEIAISGSLDSAENQAKPQQVIRNVMQNLHIIFGLSRGMYFSYQAEQNKLFCSAENINSALDLDGFNIQTEPARSLLAKAFTKKAITSSFETTESEPHGIVDQQIIRMLKTDGMLCIPLFNSEHFFGVLAAGVSQMQYPSLLQQRRLLGEFTRTAVRNLSQIKSFQEQQQDALEQANNQQSLHIRKLIHEANNPLAIITNYLA